jgi:hypothetical protein
MLCVSKLCVSKLCGDKVVWNVEVAGGRRDEQAGGGGGSAQPKTRTLHKDVGKKIAINRAIQQNKKVGNPWKSIELKCFYHFP